MCTYSDSKGLINMYPAIVELIISTLIAIESGGNDMAVGRNGEIGCLQIKKVTVDDANRILKKHKSRKTFAYIDRYDRQKSIEICKIVLTEYADKLQDTGDLSTHNLALVWNMGYKGFMTATKRNASYLRKFGDEFSKRVNGGRV